MSSRLDLEEKLVAYLEGDLTGNEAHEVEEKLKESEELRTILAELKTTNQYIDSLHKLDAASGFTETVMERIKSEEDSSKIKKLKEINIFHRFNFPKAALITGILVVSFIFIIWKFSEEEPAFNNGKIVAYKIRGQEHLIDIDGVLKANTENINDKVVKTKQLINKFDGLILDETSNGNTIIVVEIKSNNLGAFLGDLRNIDYELKSLNQGKADKSIIKLNIISN